MARSSTLDLSQTDKIASFEIACAMLELPQRRIGRSSVKDIAHWKATVSLYRSCWQDVWRLNDTFVKAIHIQLSHERRDISVLEVLPSPHY